LLRPSSSPRARSRCVLGLAASSLRESGIQAGPELAPVSSSVLTSGPRRHPYFPCKPCSRNLRPPTKGAVKATICSIGAAIELRTSVAFERGFADSITYIANPPIARKTPSMSTANSSIPDKFPKPKINSPNESSDSPKETYRTRLLARPIVLSCTILYNFRIALPTLATNATEIPAADTNPTTAAFIQPTLWRTQAPVSLRRRRSRIALTSRNVTLPERISWRMSEFAAAEVSFWRYLSSSSPAIGSNSKRRIRHHKPGAGYGPQQRFMRLRKMRRHARSGLRPGVKLVAVEST